MAVGALFNNEAILNADNPTINGNLQLEPLVLVVLLSTDGAVNPF
jgi:hypothetical protein